MVRQRLLPAVRAVEGYETRIDDSLCLVLHDPMRIGEGPLALSPLARFVVAFLDGRTTVEEIQRVFREASGGYELEASHILDVVEGLDQRGFLATDRFLERYIALRDAFAHMLSRPALLAGSAYPSDPEALTSFLDGLIGAVRIAEPGAPPLAGLITPHIDLERGGPVYGAAYQRLAASTPPRRVLVFGVAHQMGIHPFMLTRKAYDTPLGPAATDVEAVETLASACSWPPFEEEFAHRDEHSIEFQALFLRHLYGDDVVMVPILCGGLPGMGQPREAVDSFLAACVGLLAEDIDGTMAIAAVDLAHVGPSFGDEQPVNDSIMADILARDRADLTRALELDSEAWLHSVMADDNARRVCGLNAIYAMLRTIQGHAGPGELLSLSYAPAPDGGAVSFAAAAFPALRR